MDRTLGQHKPFGIKTTQVALTSNTGDSTGLVIHITGRLVLTVSDKEGTQAVHVVFDDLAPMADKFSIIVVDLSELSAIDSAGIGELAHAFQTTLAMRSECVFVGVNQTLMDIIRITRLDTLFVFAGTPDSPMTSDEAIADAGFEKSEVTA